jgi:hypothetical protein
MGFRGLVRERTSFARGLHIEEAAAKDAAVVAAEVGDAAEASGESTAVGD